MNASKQPHSGVTSNMEWYAAQVRPNSETLAMAHLERQGFTPFRPLIWERQRRGQAQARVLRPMFPGYVFVQFDVVHSDWPKIRYTRGVTRLLGNEVSGPSKIHAALIQTLKLRCASNLPTDLVQNLQTGDSVQVIRGPFADFIATVEKVDAQKRIWLLMDLMGRTARVSARPQDICLTTNSAAR